MPDICGRFSVDATAAAAAAAAAEKDGDPSIL